MKSQKYKEKNSIEPNIMSDTSNQTDSDNILEKYNKLLNENKNLETEVISWRNKGKQLMAYIRLLESENQRLALISAQMTDKDKFSSH